MAIANSIPVLTSVEDFASAEEKEENQKNMIHKANENKHLQEQLMNQISFVCLGPNSTLYSFDETFNVIVDGEILD